MIRRALLLAAVSFAAGGCNLQEAERMQLERGGPDFVAPTLRNAAIRDADGNRVDTIRLFAGTGEKEWRWNGSTWAWSGTRTLVIDASIRDARQPRVDPQGFEIFTRLIVPNEGALPWMRSGPVYWGIFPFSFPYSLPRDTSSRWTGNGEIQLSLKYAVDGESHRASTISFPVQFIDDVPRVVNPRLQDEADTIHAARFCLEADIESPASLLEQDASLDIAVFNGVRELTIGSRPHAFHPSVTQPMDAFCGSWDWGITFERPLSGLIQVRIYSKGFLIGWRTFPVDRQ